MNIQEDYVSFEVAKLLKEKGFNPLECGMYYSITTGKRTTELLTSLIACPTLQMAMKWLRKVHGLYVYPNYVDFIRHDKVEVWVVKIVDMKTFKEYSLEYTESSYEQACEAAIKYCLENLI